MLPRLSSMLRGVCGRRTYSSAVGEKPYYITTPIFYVNAAPHVGHLYTMVLTDALKRWQVLQGREAILCTGTDEHGMKIQQAASLSGIPPKEFCDSGAKVFKSLATQSNVSFDHFIRTTDQKHHDAVQHVWHLLHRAGFIYTAKHEGWYSVSDETFYPSSAVSQTLDPVTGTKLTTSIETGKPVEWTSEHNYHFRLSALRDKLLDFYASNPSFLTPTSHYRTVVDTVTTSLADLSISRPRSRLSWGIPVPTDPTQTIYVWLDALINYLTVTTYPWTPGREPQTWPADLHVIGKDIIRFHCIYWPAFLLALDLPPPRRVLAHAHWTMNRRKMSKSEGNVVNPFYALDRFGVDVMRFYMLHDGGIVDDGDYSNEGIVERYGNLLQNGLGNLVNRVCSRSFDLEAAVQRGVEGVGMDELDKRQKGVIESAAERVSGRMEKLEVPGALKEIMNLISETNGYLQHTAPWAFKDPSQAAIRDKIIFLAAEGVRVAGILLQPFMPGKMKELLDQISVSDERRGFGFAGLGKDREYGVGASGRRVMLFPPLNE